jgi:hypothetical protein
MIFIFHGRLPMGVESASCRLHGSLAVDKNE